MPHSKTDSDRRFGWFLTVSGIIGLIASATLLVEKMALLQNPDHIPSCNFNPVMSCSSVMTQPQAEAFGIPNPVIGVAGFAAVAMIGASVLAGAVFRRWYWICAQVGVTFAVTFIHWLIWQSLYSIGALCPWCIVVWAVTIPVFWFVTVRNLRGWTRAPWVTALTRYQGAILTAWYLLVCALITVRFWDYWSSLV